MKETQGPVMIRAKALQGKTFGKAKTIRYADNTTLMAESKEEVKSLLMRVKEESEKADLKFNSQKPKIMASDPITSWQIDGSGRLYFREFRNHCGWWVQP